MSRRVPLPAELATAPFRVHAALSAGVTPGRLRSSDLARLFHGARSVGDVSRAQAYSPLLRPGDRFSHRTAAELWGVPLPASVNGDLLHVSATLPANRPRRPGIIGHVTAEDESVLREGLPVSHAARMFVELGTELSIDDLVAVGDALVLDPHVLDPREPRPWVTLEDLADAVSRSRAPGSRRARDSLALVRPGAESRPESLLRLLLMRAGLPEPELNVPLSDRAGRHIGRFDIVYRRQGVVVEYDGDQHRSSVVQYERDLDRLERVTGAGWHVVRVRARGLFVHPDATVERVCSALSESPRFGPGDSHKA